MGEGGVMEYGGWGEGWRKLWGLEEEMVGVHEGV